MHLAFGELQLKTENRNLLGTWKLEETLAKEMTWEGASPTIFQAPLTLVDSRGEGYGMRTYHMPGHDLGYPCSFSPSCFFFFKVSYSLYGFYELDQGCQTYTLWYMTGPADRSFRWPGVDGAVTLSLLLPLALDFPPHGLCEVGEEGGGQRGRYLQLCRGRSRSPAVGWPRLCNSPLRSPGWQGRRDRRQVLGCWPPGSLRAAPGWSLPGKRARQNSVEHCSYSGLVCRE